MAYFEKDFEGNFQYSYYGVNGVILGEAAQALQCPICFDVLYYAQETDDQAILEEIGQKEGELIRQYRPLLNTQIPKAENWHKWDVDKRSTEEIMRLLLEE